MEIAIGILRADPKEDVTPARGWALDIIEKNSGVPFSQQDREALLHKPLSAKVALLGYGGIEGVDGFPGLLGAMMKKGRAFVGRALRQAGRRPVRDAGRDRGPARKSTSDGARRCRSATGGARAPSVGMVRRGSQSPGQASLRLVHEQARPLRKRAASSSGRSNSIPTTSKRLTAPEPWTCSMAGAS